MSNLFLDIYQITYNHRQKMDLILDKDLMVRMNIMVCPIIGVSSVNEDVQNQGTIHSTFN